MAEGNKDEWVMVDLLEVALAGKNRSGKSTLLSNLEEESALKLSATKDPDHIVTTMARETLRIVDIDKSQQVNVLVYCIPVSPGCKFHDGNPEVIDALFQAYDEEIWEHCVVVLTFSNMAWDRINSNNSDPETTRTMYKDYIEKYQNLFCKELNRKLQSTSIQPEAIPVIPAGGNPQDPVLPDGGRWRDEVLQKIISQRSNTNIKKKSRSVWEMAGNVKGAIKNGVYNWWGNYYTSDS